MPVNWQQVTQRELRYIYYLRSSGVPMNDVKCLFFLRKAGMNIVRSTAPGKWLCQYLSREVIVSTSSLAWAVDKLAWMDLPSEMPIRLEKAGGVDAVSPVLHGISFGDWISLENLYQGFILSHNIEALRDMAVYLYPGCDKEQLSDVDIFNISQWYAMVKMFFARKWSHLFSGDGGSGTFNPEASMNAMIRALTGGDVLKESALLNDIDVWRALEELNQKAKEAAEFKAKTK